MAGTVRIPIPLSHTAMVSYQYARHILPLQCPNYESEYFYRVILGVKDHLSLQHLWNPCRNKRDRTIVVKESASEMFVTYSFLAVYHIRTGSIGFRFFFSFHDRSVLPSRLQDGRWNCSVPHWADFQAHFPCNMETDCVHGEDEQDCPYNNVSRCGAGAISLGELCYFYVISETDVTWNDAMDMCDRNDAHLASLGTPKEWNDVMDLLTVREAAAYLGLRSANLHLPY